MPAPAPFGWSVSSLFHHFNLISYARNQLALAHHLYAHSDGPGVYLVSSKSLRPCLDEGGRTDARGCQEGQYGPHVWHLTGDGVPAFVFPALQCQWDGPGGCL